MKIAHATVGTVVVAGLLLGGYHVIKETQAKPAKTTVVAPKPAPAPKPIKVSIPAVPDPTPAPPPAPAKAPVK